MLRRRIGGAKLMWRQVRHIIDTVEQRPTVSVRILPNDVVAHVGLAGLFVILEFAKAPTIVHVETLMAGLFLDTPDEVQFYRLAEQRLTELALSDDESLRLMKDIAHDLSKE